MATQVKLTGEKRGELLSSGLLVITGCIRVMFPDMWMCVGGERGLGEALLIIITI